eukprot:scaffold462_cov195-Pinguiococcus_pyrenoidosus.AAC.70
MQYARTRKPAGQKPQRWWLLVLGASESTEQRSPKPKSLARPRSCSAQPARSSCIALWWRAGKSWSGPMRNPRKSLGIMVGQALGNAGEAGALAGTCPAPDLGTLITDPWLPSMPSLHALLLFPTGLVTSATARLTACKSLPEAANLGPRNKHRRATDSSLQGFRERALSCHLSGHEQRKASLPVHEVLAAGGTYQRFSVAALTVSSEGSWNAGEIAAAAPSRINVDPDSYGKRLEARIRLRNQFRSALGSATRFHYGATRPLSF